MDIRQFFFKYRSYTPIPIVLLILLYYSKPIYPYYIIGVALMIIGEFIRIDAVRYAGGATRTRNVGAPFLCTSGPYSQTRIHYTVEMLLFMLVRCFLLVELDVAYSSLCSRIFYFSILQYNFFRRRNFKDKVQRSI